jgi:carbon monoxide dehydrogenase subunit G
MKLKNCICIDATPESVWSVLSDLENVALWVDAIEHAKCDPGLNSGIGARRTCTLTNGQTIHESWTAWDEGHGFAYEGQGLRGLKRASNAWTIEGVGDQTLLCSDAVVEFSGVFGALLGYLARPLFVRMGRRSLAAFKYLVEQGQSAPSGARLQIGPMAC